MAKIDGPWRFHRGDDPGFADPQFDDNSWKLLRPDQPWSASGEKNAAGFAWYRFRVNIPADVRESALFLTRFNPSHFESDLGTSSLEVFAEGKIAGRAGAPPPHQRVMNIPYLIVPLGSGDGRARTVTVAIRAWNWKLDDALWSGPYSRLGSQESIQDWKQSFWRLNLWFQFQIFSLMLVYLLGCGGLLLFILRRREREYLWFGLYELFALLTWCAFESSQLYTFQEVLVGPIEVVIYSVKDWVCILFLERISLGWRHSGFRLAKAAVVTVFIAELSRGLFPVLRSGQEPSLVSYLSILSILAELLFAVGIVSELCHAMRTRVPDARFVLAAFGFFRIAVGLYVLSHLFAALGWPIAERLVSLETMSFIRWPFPIGMYAASEFLVQVAILAVLGLRFARSRRDEERYKTELESARVVQQVLVPAEIPEVPGYGVEAVYRPAGQVGGDFFQVIPTRGDGVLIVIGDVSGKGMPAAMTVSLLVGTVRTLAHYTQSPGEILAAMNQRMLARSKDGFTTCLVARVEADGSVTAANAGHLAPYLDGCEVAIQNGLPLGLVAGAEYEETQLTLGPGQQLTLMTDGVVEAQSKSRELFGFERAAATAGGRAERIAQTAIAFGQQDDITVVTVRRVAATISEASGVVKLAPLEA